MKPLQLTEGKIVYVYTYDGPVEYTPVYNKGVVLIYVDLPDLNEVMVDVEIGGKIKTFHGEVFDSFVSKYN